jgi:hypothetical protein
MLHLFTLIFNKLPVSVLVLGDNCEIRLFQPPRKAPVAQQPWTFSHGLAAFLLNELDFIEHMLVGVLDAAVQRAKPAADDVPIL